MSRFFSHRVTWLMLLVAAGIGALFAHTLVSMRNGHWDYQLRTSANLSSTLSKGLEWSLDAIDHNLQKAATALQETQALDKASQCLAEQNVLLAALWRGIEGGSLTVLDGQGRVLNPLGHASADVAGVRAPEGHSFADSDFFQAFAAARAHQGVFIGRPQKGLLTTEYVLPVACAMWQPVAEGEAGPAALQGVVVGFLRLEEINVWLASMPMGAHSGVNIIRHDGLVLSRFPYQDNERLHSLAGSANLARFLATDHGSFVGQAVIDKVERLYSHTRVGNYPLVINVAQATSSIWAKWTRNVWLLAAFTLALMVGCMALAAMLVHELSRRAATQKALTAEKEILRMTLQSIGEAVVCTDAQGRITYLNPAAKALTGLRMQEADNEPVELLHPLQDTCTGRLHVSPLRQALDSGAPLERTRTVLQHRFSLQQVEMEGSASLLKSPQGVVLGAVAVLRDITELAAHEAHMQRLAFHDALTGLPNRLLLQDRAQQAMAQSRRTHELMAVVYLDLDGFKQINDSLGHRVGDEALKHIARALQACVRDSDTVSRLGGDEFVVLAPELASHGDVLAMARKIQDACAQPFVWQGQSYVLHASGGVALHPTHGQQWEALLHSADTAMYTAKKHGRHQIRCYQAQGEASLLTQAQMPEGVDQTPA